MIAPGTAALIVGHPGHELRVYRWLELAKPTVYVLTDGSGHTGRSRLASTHQVLSDAGASPGTLFGAFSDVDLYDALLTGEHTRLRHVVCTLAEALARTSVDYVVADALEGFNPGTTCAGSWSMRRSRWRNTPPVGRCKTTTSCWMAIPPPARTICAPRP